MWYVTNRVKATTLRNLIVVALLGGFLAIPAEGAEPLVPLTIIQINEQAGTNTYVIDVNDKVVYSNSIAGSLQFEAFIPPGSVCTLTLNDRTLVKREILPTGMTIKFTRPIDEHLFYQNEE